MILIADDEKNIRNGLSLFLKNEGFEVLLAADGAEALEIARTHAIACALVDLRMPKIDGDVVLRSLVSEIPLLPVIILTGHGTVENAVKAMQNGAYDFITKPIHLDRLLALIKRALENRKNIVLNRSLRAELQDLKSAQILVAKSAAMQRVIAVTKQVASTQATVLISGESGVGKERIVDMLHAASPRRNAPLIKVHCAALSESLLESELFGHEQGAFTGATAQRKGRFELAQNGTILLDEIGEITPHVQVKILRVLQEKKFERVGGEKTIAVDVRITAATNRNLLSEVEQGNFREDLYYRLNVVHIEVPPLRERTEEIPLLAQAFLEQFKQENNLPQKRFSEETLKYLVNYRWPGNIRELKNSVESACIMSATDTIHPHNLPKHIHEIKAHADNVTVPRGSTLATVEELIIKDTLKMTNNNKTKTAALLGMQRMTLYDKMRKYNL